MKTFPLLILTFSACALYGAEPAHDTLIAHRGESVDAPENTLPAYRTAVSRGFGFECDVYLSADGRVFTFHDNELTRTTGGRSTNRCERSSWADEISKVDVGGWGKWKGSRFSPTRPALLEEVLSLATDGRQIYIELKSGPKIVPYLKEIFARQSKATAKNTLFISFGKDTCAALKREMPAFRVFWLTGARHEDRPKSPEDILSVLRETKADGVDCNFDKEVVTAAFVKAIRDAGYEFHVWTVDRLDDTLLAFSRGAQTVTTNCAKKQLDEYRARVSRDLPLAKAEKRPGWDAEKFTMGAIRWDAWYGFGETDSASEEACGTLLHPAHRWRLPFFADVAADGKVTIDGRKVKTLEREIDFAADGGLDYWAFLTYENGRSMNNALPYYLKAKNRSRLGFCIVLIMYRTDAWRWPDTCARWLSYLDESGYKKVCGGRELVFVYPDLVPGEYLADFRRKAKERGHNPYYVGMTFAKPAVREKVAKNCAGMDAVGAYNFVRNAEDYGRMMDFLEENQWNAAAKDGLVLVPSVNAGFDASPRRDTEVSWQKGQFKGKTYHPPLTREQLTEATRRAKRFVLSHPTTCEAKTCLWYAWNEFDEGGWLCPTRKADGTPDTMRLEAVKAGSEDPVR